MYVVSVRRSSLLTSSSEKACKLSHLASGWEFVDVFDEAGDKGGGRALLNGFSCPNLLYVTPAKESRVFA